MSNGVAPGTGARSVVNAARLWAGGTATALVAALVAIVALLVITVLIDVTPVAPGWLVGDGSDASLTTRFAVTAAIAALLATALLHLLLLATPRPRLFFGWIVSLVTIAATVSPFAVNADLGAQVATAVTAALVGLVVGTLLAGVGAAATRRRPGGPLAGSGHAA
jgi:hypothetical protein